MIFFKLILAINNKTTPKLVNFLLNNEANINDTNEYGRTALHLGKLIDYRF